MYPPIFETLNVLPGITSVFGSPARIYPFGEAPDEPTLPYATFQLINGDPENYLSDVPDIDLFQMQIDVYSSTQNGVRTSARAIRDGIEPYAHVENFNFEGRDPVTRDWRYSFDVDWWTPPIKIINQIRTRFGGFFYTCKN